MTLFQTDENYVAAMKGWECQETDRGIPFYINTLSRRTDWNHPYYNKVIEELEAFQDVHYAAYRSALKLRHLQTKFGLHQLSLTCLENIFHDHGFPRGSSGVVDSQSLQLLLLDIFHTADFRHFDTFRQDVASELLHNYLLNLFDLPRSGFIRVQSIKLALAALCNSDLSEKYKYFFQEIRSSQGFVNHDHLASFVSDLIHIPDLLRESVAFGKNVYAAVDSCMQVAGSLGDGVPEKGFYAWLMREPQTLIWLPTLHRLIAAETVKHDCKCNICKVTPIVGFRYKCLQCFKFNICQNCFFHGKTTRSHQIRHPIQEYCLPVTAKDETKVFLKVVRNKMSRQSKKASKVPFLPVDSTTDQGSLEWEMQEIPSPPTPPPALPADASMVEGEAASDDSGHNSDHGGEGSQSSLPAAPSSPSSGSSYDNSNSPVRYLEERKFSKSANSFQDRRNLLHLVHRLRKENRLLRQQLQAGLCSSSEVRGPETWRACATAEVSTASAGDRSLQSLSESLRHDVHSITNVTPLLESLIKNDSTLSPISELSSTEDQQPYTSDFFNSILGASNITTGTFNVTTQTGIKSRSKAEAVFASTPDHPTPILKTGPRKPPRLTGLGEKNTVSLSYIQADSSLASGSRMQLTRPAAVTFSHRVQVHSGEGLAVIEDDREASDGSGPTPSRQKLVSYDSSDIIVEASPQSQRDSSDETALQLAMQSVVDSVNDLQNVANETLKEERHEISCEEMWANTTPCTIRKQVCKPTRLVPSNNTLSGPTFSETLHDSRRKSTGSADDLIATNTTALLSTPDRVKRWASLNRLGLRTPGTDKSMFAQSGFDSVMTSPERQEIDKVIAWIDSAFPSNLSYSALSLLREESTIQSKMLQAAEGISNAMSDLVQAAADKCYK